MASSLMFDFDAAGGQRLSGRLEWPLAAPKAFAIFAHCFTCSKNAKAATQISRALAARGIAVLRFDFTGIGNSEGDFANTDFSSNIDDIRAAADALRKNYQAPALLVGHSLGGAAVLIAAAEMPDVRAVATINAPSEASHLLQLLEDALPEIATRGAAYVRLGGNTFTISRQFVDDLRSHRVRDALEHLAKPLLIVQGAEDDIVEDRHAFSLLQHAQHPKSLLSVPTADHLLTKQEDADYIAEVLAAWAGRYLETSPAPRHAPPEGHVLVQSTHARYAQEVIAGDHSIISDEPVDVGGDNAGMSPYDLLLAALGTCTSMTLRMYANRKQWPLESARVTLRHERIHAQDCEDCETQTGKLERITRVVAVEGPLDESQRARLIEIAEKCPVHKTLTSTPVIQTVEESST